MWAVHFEEQDLRRITISGTPALMEELVLGVASLRRKWHDPAARRRRAYTVGRLTPEVKPLLDLVSATQGEIPDFLFPPVTAFGDALDAIEEASRDDRLIRAIRAYHAAAVHPFWSVLTSSADTDRNTRARLLVDGGVDCLLATLHPTLVWQPPLLIKTGEPGCVSCLADAAKSPVRLDGRGLLLVPSASTAAVAFGALPGQTPVLVYPVPEAVREPAPTALAALLGTTRAAILLSLARPGTTSEIARRAGVSIASASEHASVLRNAGLVISVRLRNSVLHSRTPLAELLIDLP